jgi:hypothetical protein
MLRQFVSTGSGTARKGALEREKACETLRQNPTSLKRKLYNNGKKTAFSRPVK